MIVGYRGGREPGFPISDAAVELFPQSPPVNDGETAAKSLQERRNTMIRCIACLLVVSLFFPVGFSLADTDREAAIAAAKQWVTLIDAGQYAQSWDEAAQLFQESIRRPDWVKSLEMVRIPLGAVVTRNIRNTANATSLPGAPEGEYLIIEFDTAFRDKAGAIETVTSARDTDGKWRVAGYYIR
jgi:hypothetical protein